MGDLRTVQRSGQFICSTTTAAAWLVWVAGEEYDVLEVDLVPNSGSVGNVKGFAGSFNQVDLPSASAPDQPGRIKTFADALASAPGKGSVDTYIGGDPGGNTLPTTVLDPGVNQDKLGRTVAGRYSPPKLQQKQALVLLATVNGTPTGAQKVQWNFVLSRNLEVD